MTKADADALLAHLETLSHADVARLYNRQVPDSEEADVIAASWN